MNTLEIDVVYSTLKHPDFSRLPRMHLFGTLALAAMLAAGCGGSDTADAPKTLTVAGTVADGPLEGAQVFLDLNSNFERDSNEPISGPSNAAGSFTLVVGQLTQAQLATAQLVSIVPDTAKDIDDGGKTLAEAGRPGFILASPAAEFLAVAADGALRNQRPAFVSPLTTLVAAEIATNGLTLAEARSSVREMLELPEDADPMDDFVANPGKGLGAKARETADRLGGIGQTVSAIAQEQGGQAIAEQIRDIVATFKAELPRGPNGNPGRPGVEDVEDVEDGTPPVNNASANSRRLNQLTPSAALVPASRAPTFSDYVVRFKDTVGNPAAQAANAVAGFGGQIKFTYDTALKGFAVTLPSTAAEAFVEALERNPNVESVESDIAMTAFQTTQSAATWGLDRSDQRALPLSGSYTYNANGSGVRAYIVDTGILSSHTDFGGRVSGGYTAIADGRGTTDCNGHGTHVAGTVGAATWGIAKGVALVPVRVLDCNGSGTLSGVIAGVDWVAKNGQKPGVLNLSLGGGASSSLDTAVANTVAAGYTVVVAAGNDSGNACNYSPAREPTAITVGSTASNDTRSTFSNFGTCLDLFAPGSSIRSTWYTSTTATATISGTSMAAPHVAGLAALLLQNNPTASAATVTSAVINLSTPSVVLDAGSGSPNRLLYTLDSSSGGGSDGGTTTEPTTTVVGVANLTGSTTKVRNGWRATVNLLVTDAAGKAVAGASVAGGFTAGGSSVSCTTGSNGTCSVSTGNLSNKTSFTTYTVQNVTGTSMSFNGVKSSITVSKPS
jgi:subtilisin family serine protease